MSDAIHHAVARKVAIDAARAALRSGSRAGMLSALSGLPPNGSKAERLRTQLREALSRSSATSERTTRQSAASVSCVSDGIGYEFRIAETGDVAFFVVRRVGAIVSVIINSVHPFGRQLAESDEWMSPTLLALLAGWAHYELEQSDHRRENVIRDARVDWGRVVQRLLLSGPGFRID